MSSWTGLVAAVMVLAGSLLTLGAAVGLLRFRDTLSRMHPAAKPQTLGLVLVLLGATVRVVGDHGIRTGDLGLLVVAVLCALATAPVVANRVGTVAYDESRD